MTLGITCFMKTNAMRLLVKAAMPFCVIYINAPGVYLLRIEILANLSTEYTHSIF